MEIRVPRLGEGADSGNVVSIFVKEGDTVAKDQLLIELENEKAVAPIMSTDAGVVSKIHVKVGDKITVGQLIVTLSGGAASSAPVAAPIKEEPKFQAPPQAAPAHGPAPVVPGVPAPASPSVRKMAADLGIDLTRVRGSERGGRITLEDVKAYIQSLQNLASSGGAPQTHAAAKPAAASEQIDFSKWGPVTKKPFSSLRQKIAQKMVESWTTIPHVTQFDNADITALLQLRKKYVAAYEKKGAALTLTSFILKASVEALKRYPQFNASLDETSHELVLKSYYHLGVAVDTEQGLIVPVLRDVDKKSLLEISKELAGLAEKTRQRKVSLDELKGGTFTISNLGGIGGSHFTPIINKPEVAILGVGRGADKLPLALSYDHRVIDGADGARFIRALAEALENFKEEAVKI